MHVKVHGSAKESGCECPIDCSPEKHGSATKSLARSVQGIVLTNSPCLGSLVPTQ